MANETNQGRRSDRNEDVTGPQEQKRPNPFGEQESQGNEQPRRAPGSEQEYQGGQPEPKRAPGVEEDDKVDDDGDRRKSA